MEQPHNIVLILGNGFDLDLGLKTSYKDFWESNCCPKDYPAPLIKHLNGRWGDKLEAVRWYDLENELREYALNGDKSDVISEQERQYILSHPDDMLTSDANYSGIDDICQELIQKGVVVVEEDRSKMKYVRVPYREDIQFDGLFRDKEAIKRIKKGLCSYLNNQSCPPFYSNSVAAAVCRAVSNALESGSIINVYSFNYTHIRSIDSILETISVNYMHGDAKRGNIIIGTKDDLSLDESYDFLQKSFDPNYNPPHLVDDLAEADEVIIFGHSLGDNDRQYFAPFFQQQVGLKLTKIKDITIFTRDEISKIDTKRALQRMTDGKLSDLYGRNNVTIIRTAELVDDLSVFRTFLNRYVPNDDLRGNNLGNVLIHK